VKIMKKYKLLNIITDLNTGGAERALYNLLYGGLAEQFDCHVISLMDEGTYGAKIKKLGVSVTCIGMRGKIGIPFYLLRLIEAVRSIAPDIIQCHMYHANLLGGLVGKFSQKAPVLWGIHNTTFDVSTPKTTLFVVKIGAVFSSKLSDKIICCAKAAKETHVRFGYDDENILIIPNGTDTDCFKFDQAKRIMLRKALQLSENVFVFGLVARWHPQKDINNFLKAAAILLKKYRDMHFVLIGDGLSVSNEFLTKTMENLKLNENITLLGRQDDIPAFMSFFDVYVSSSSFGEAFPMVIGEAMACCLPCVVTDVGDSAYIVDDTGVVVPPQNSEALAAGMEKLYLMSRRERRTLGQKARARIIENFSLQTIVKKYIDLYEKQLADLS